ncbi:MAG: heavy metal translocating P-type ATPase [Myxococcales bacterium]|nr:heavy metal translocating P-type ATPase [Myxococcales bacterium]
MQVRVAHELPNRIRLELSELPPGPALAQRIEHAARSLPGVKSASFRLRTQSLVVHHDGRRDGLLAALERLEPPALPPSASPEKDELRELRDDLVRSALRALVGQALTGLPKAALSLYGSLPFLLKGLRSLEAKRLDADLLDAAAIGVSLRMGDHKTGSVITLLLKLGDYIRLRTELRARRDLTSILARDEREVWVRRNGVEVRVDNHEVKVGELVVLRQGSVVPVDGVVVSGRATVDQSSMTGESLPVLKRKGTTVYEGTTLVEGQLEVEAQRVGDETRISKIVRLIEQGEEQKAASQHRAAKLADRLVPYVLSAAGLTKVATGDSGRAASVLLVDYSCALKLCVPISIKTCMMEALRGGVLIRGGKYLEALADADTFVFDKTGTLTEAKPKVVGVVPVNGYDRLALLRDAACVEEHFPHPVAAAIVREAAQEGLGHAEENHGEVKYLVGHGIVSEVRGKRFVVGSRRFLVQNQVSLAGENEVLHGEGNTVVYVGADGCLAGAFLVEDPLREEAPEVLSALKAMGAARTVLLTGDGAANARRVAKAGFDEVHAEVSPEDKAEVVRELKRRGCRVAMVGDGINDAPALSVADVGISFQHGADLARETADVLILRPDLRCLPHAVRLARLAKARVEQNFRYIVSINSVLIASAFLGGTPPALSALLHNLTTVYTSLRSLRPYLPAKHRPTGAQPGGTVACTFGSA